MHHFEFEHRRAKKGMVEPLILHALAEKPMTGYEIMQSLETSSHGLWKPSPGSVYPTLQLLVEKDLATVKDENGKKVYALTEAGTQSEHAVSTDTFDKLKDKKHYIKLRKLVHEIGHTTKDIAMHGDEATIEELEKSLTDALETIQAIKKA